MSRGAPTAAASLSAATGDDLERSARHRELRRPHGFGDELRAALADDSTPGAHTPFVIRPVADRALDVAGRT